MPPPPCAWRLCPTCRPGRRSTSAAARVCWPRPGPASGAGRCGRSTPTRARSTQARRSLAAAGLEGRVELWRGPLERLVPADLADRVILANLPAPAQAALLGRIGSPPRAALLSGLRPGQAAPLLAGYRALGLRPAAAARRGRWECWALVGG